MEKVKDTLTGLVGMIPKFDPRAGNILVTSGNGTIGHRVATILLKAGYPTVRVGARDLGTVQDLKDEGAEEVRFLWEEPETYAMALVGVKSVFCTMPHHTPGWDKYFPAFMDACHKAGVNHIVKVSFYHAILQEAASMSNFATATRAKDEFHSIPMVEMHHNCDERLMKSAWLSNYTILFPSHMMSNVLVFQGETIRKEQKFYGASGGHGINYVSPNDVAEVATHSLLAPKDHFRQGYTLTGPEPIFDRDVADLLSRNLGKTVTYVDLPLDEFKHSDKKPDWLTADDVIYLEHAKATGTEEDKKFVSHDIDRICGHPAETYEEYLLGKQTMIPEELEFLRP